MSVVISGGGAFFPKIVESRRIYANDETITSAKLTATTTGDVSFALSADDGSNYENITSGSTHNFTNTGKYLKWKAILNPGATITNIEVEW